MFNTLAATVLGETNEHNGQYVDATSLLNNRSGSCECLPINYIMNVSLL